MVLDFISLSRPIGWSDAAQAADAKTPNAITTVRRLVNCFFIIFLSSFFATAIKFHPGIERLDLTSGALVEPTIESERDYAAARRAGELRAFRV